MPGSLGWGSAVLAAMAILAPSRAALNAMALPMPLLAPVMKRVFLRTYVNRNKFVLKHFYWKDRCVAQAVRIACMHVYIDLLTQLEPFPNRAGARAGLDSTVEC